MASHKLPVQLACRVLGVSESGYYDRRTRPLSPRALRHAWLTEQIRAVHQSSFGKGQLVRSVPRRLLSGGGGIRPLAANSWLRSESWDT
jgi:hypothetical protein